MKGWSRNYTGGLPDMLRLNSSHHWALSDWCHSQTCIVIKYHVCTQHAIIWKPTCSSHTSRAHTAAPYRKRCQWYYKCLLKQPTTDWLTHTSYRCNIAHNILTMSSNLVLSIFLLLLLRLFSGDVWAILQTAYVIVDNTPTYFTLWWASVRNLISV